MFNQNFYLKTYPKKRIIDTKTRVKSEFYGYEYEIDYKNNFESKIVYNKLFLSNLCFIKYNFLKPYLIKYHIPKNITSILESDIISSSLPFKTTFATIKQRFLVNVVN